MKRALASAIVILALAALGSPLAAQEPEPTNYLVFGNPLPADFEAGVVAAGGTMVRSLDAIDLAMVRSSEGASFAAAIESLPGVERCVEDPVVQWIPEPDISADQIVTADDDDDAPPPPNPKDGAFFGPCQWSLDNLDAAGAWFGLDDDDSDSDSSVQFGDPGIKVAVLDTGVDPFHQDLAGKVDLANSLSVLSSPSICDSFAPDQTSFVDFDFHGSFVSGEIAASGLGIVGLAPASTIVGVKVLSCLGSGSFGDVITGILVAATTPGVEVINMSLGAVVDLTASAGLVSALQAAVDFAHNQGVLVVAASGNNSINFDSFPTFAFVPAMLNNVVSVSATAIDDSLSSFSNHGLRGADLGAPGGDFPNPAAPLPGCVVNPVIQSFSISVCSSQSITIPACSAANNFYILGSGTSFASPLVAAAAALAESEAREDGNMTPAEHTANLLATVDDLGVAGTDPIFAAGRLNAARAVDEAEAEDDDSDSDSDD